MEDRQIDRAIESGRASERASERCSAGGEGKRDVASERESCGEREGEMEGMSTDRCSATRVDLARSLSWRSCSTMMDEICVYVRVCEKD